MLNEFQDITLKCRQIKIFGETDENLGQCSCHKIETRMYHTFTENNKSFSDYILNVFGYSTI